MTEVEVEVSTFKVDLRNAFALVQEEKRSALRWASIEDEDRGVVCLVVQDILLRLAENPDTWLPGNLEFVANGWVKVGLRFQLGDADVAACRREAQSHVNKQAMSELLSLETDLR
jgi:hypothetical protein